MRDADSSMDSWQCNQIKRR